jgi:2-C-methyl-D-erythritol 4-phosphate cytidylyltransferase
LYFFPDFKLSSIAFILTAGGSGSRFGRNKLLERLKGKYVIEHALHVLKMPVPGMEHAGVFVSTTPGTRTVLEGLDTFAGVTFVDGGASRAHSVFNALQHVPGDVDFVAVHDAARPLVSSQLIQQLCECAIIYGSAVPALAVKLTIKQACGPLPARVIQTLPRAELWEMQTPQIARRDELLNAYASAYQSNDLSLEHITDDAHALERAGHTVWLTPGDERNIKITTPQDLIIAEQLMMNQ